MGKHAGTTNRTEQDAIDMAFDFMVSGFSRTVRGDRAASPTLATQRLEVLAGLAEGFGHDEVWGTVNGLCVAV